jgi:hypothetical protein
MNAKEYFWSKCKMVVELEDEDGYRFWSEPMSHEACDEYIARKCKTEADDTKFYYFSDMDFVTTEGQPNTFVKRVMKLAELNFYKNPEWCKKHNLGSLYAVIDFICDNDLWKTE